MREGAGGGVHPARGARLTPARPQATALAVTTTRRLFTPAQIPDPSGDIRKAAQQVGQIYSKYGALMTAASVIATWAVIHTATSGSHRSH